MDRNIEAKKEAESFFFACPTRKSLFTCGKEAFLLRAFRRVYFQEYDART